jgi:hypothetical protein
MNINKSCLGVFSHRSVGASLKTGGIFTVTTLEGKLLSLHIDPWNGLRFFIDGSCKFLGGG